MVRVKSVVVGAVLVVVALAAGATAHPYSYINHLGQGDWALQCVPDPFPSEGGVCIPAGHVAPNLAGTATLQISDDLVNPASGFYCQDLDVDGFCGEQDVDDPDCTSSPNPFPGGIKPGLCGDVFEPAEPFCASLTLERNWNWLPEHHIYVFVDGPIFGNPATSPCGTLSTALQGNVQHS